MFTTETLLFWNYRPPFAYAAVYYYYLCGDGDEDPRWSRPTTATKHCIVRPFDLQYFIHEASVAQAKRCTIITLNIYAYTVRSVKGFLSLVQKPFANRVTLNANFSLLAAAVAATAASHLVRTENTGAPRTFECLSRRAYCTPIITLISCYPFYNNNNNNNIVMVVTFLSIQGGLINFLNVENTKKSNFESNFSAKILNFFFYVFRHETVMNDHSFSEFRFWMWMSIDQKTYLIGALKR